MASVSQFSPYQCDQCGTANIVAAPIAYQQGTHTYSTMFNSGTTQSFSAQAVAPPHPRGYLRPFLVWGPAIIIFFVWTVIGVSSIYEHPATSALRPSAVAVFLFLGAASLVGMVFSLRGIARYNREVYPTSVELGTHLRLQTLRETELHPFIMIVAAFVWLIPTMGQRERFLPVRTFGQRGRS
jgi:hypothetical protein